MEACYSSSSVTVASLTESQSVTQVKAMAASNSIAIVHMDDTQIQAMDAEDWATCADMIGSDIQAAFTLKAEDDGTLKWMGFTGGSWVSLTGVTPAEGTYDVKIDLDYSLRVQAEINAPRIRYSIRPADSSGEYTPLVGDTEWIAIGTSDRYVVNGVDLYGFATTGPVAADAGVRPAEGSVAKVEDVSMSYDKMTLKVAATDTWGVDKVVVTLRNRFDGTVNVVTQTLAQAERGTNTFDLSDSIFAGHSYSYAVQLTGSYGGSAISTQSSHAGVDLFSTNSWFYFTGTGFVNATKDANITVEDGAFFATNEDVEGRITPTGTAPANVGTVVTTVMDVSGICPDGDLPTFDDDDRPQFAITLGGTDDSHRRWKYYSNGAWHDGADGLPTVNGTYEGRATFDYTSIGHPVVVYEIRLMTDAGSYFEPMAASVDISQAGKAALAAVAVCGGGSVSKLDATVKLAEPPPVQPDNEKHEIVVERNATVSLESMDTARPYTITKTAGRHLQWTDAAGKYAKVNSQGKLEVKSGTPANGLSSYHSHVLGLDSDKALDKPAAVVKPGADPTGGLKVYVPNVRANADSGRTVWLQRQKSTDGGTSWSNDGEAVGIGSEVTIPYDGSLYRVNTIIK